ncbi:hypothetical protein ADK35_13120 [Streptomyces viridochromogenes]|nr:hypothetical protein ADK35_13120 [Streptomyces viridochromogenes]KOG27165.1 hypothetical protein ADK36_00950 [Streptomyces viridochromogenes]
MTLYWRIFLLNAAVFVAAVLLLLGPVTVSTPVLFGEAANWPRSSAMTRSTVCRGSPCRRSCWPVNSTSPRHRASVAR